MCRVPDILYKYRPITDADRNGDGCSGFTRNLLQDGALYFSRFSELNDPNEAIFEYSSEVEIAIACDELGEYPNDMQKELLPDGRRKLKVSGRSGAEHVRRAIDERHGVLCLTEDSKNLLMYDYYAGGHKGICVGIEWKELGLLHKGTERHQVPTKVMYRKEPPIINPCGDVDFNSVFYSKWEEYKHEKEFRLSFRPGLYECNSRVLKSIKNIIFGCATPLSDIELIMGWAKHLNITYKEAYLKEKTYNLKIRDFCFDRSKRSK